MALIEGRTPSGRIKPLALNEDGTLITGIGESNGSAGDYARFPIVDVFFLGDGETQVPLKNHMKSPKKVMFSGRLDGLYNDIRWAFEPGKVEGCYEPFLILPAGITRTLDGLALTDPDPRLYFCCPEGATLVVERWF